MSVYANNLGWPCRKVNRPWVFAKCILSFLDCRVFSTCRTLLSSSLSRSQSAGNFTACKNMFAASQHPLRSDIPLRDIPASVFRACWPRWAPCGRHSRRFGLRFFRDVAGQVCQHTESAFLSMISAAQETMRLVGHRRTPRRYSTRSR